ncbi:MAG: NAD(P)H-dependent oxidoreductase [Sediminicola sp.]
MRTLLRIDSSLRNEGSYSRQYGDIFMRLWLTKYPDTKVVYRDVNQNKLPHLSRTFVNALFEGKRDALPLEVSNGICGEMKHADILLITCPTYNFGIPASLKTYFDHLVRINETVKHDGSGGYTGLLPNKKAFLLTSMGNRKSNPEVPELFEMHLQKLLNFMGITDVRMMSVHGTALPDFMKDQEPHYIERLKQLI